MRLAHFSSDTGLPLEVKERLGIDALVRLGAIITGIAPHAATVRASYFPPVGKSARTGATEIALRVRTAPGVRGTPQIWQEYGIIVSMQRIFTAWTLGVAVNDGHDELPIGGFDVPNPFGTRIQTSDDSTGGTMDYAYGFVAAEFPTNVVASTYHA